jgi:hypothetical protein
MSARRDRAPRGGRDVTRVRFEIRILGVTKAQIFYYDDEIPDLFPAVGDHAYPSSLLGHPTRRVVGIDGPHSGRAATVYLEAIDCSHGEFSLARGIATLRTVGWKQ